MRGGRLRRSLRHSGHQTPCFVPAREGAETCRVPIPLTVAALGGAIEVPVIDGAMTEMKVNAGTQTGHQTQLKGKGMSVLRSAARGDLYVNWPSKRRCISTNARKNCYRNSPPKPKTAKRIRKRKFLQEGKGRIRGLSDPRLLHYHSDRESMVPVEA